jgi:hypothetical protein
MALFGAAAPSGGDIRPITKWDARAGKFFLVERIQGVDGWTTNPREISEPVFLIDMDSLEVGYVAFNPAPDFHLILQSDAESGAAAYPAQPTPDHRPTFRVNIKLKADQGGDEPLRTFGSQAVCVRAAFNDLHTLYEAQKADHGGEMPVARVKGGVIQKFKNGSTNYAPDFEIIAWQAVSEDVVDARPESVALPFDRPAAPAADLEESVPITSDAPAPTGAVVV